MLVIVPSIEVISMLTRMHGYNTKQSKTNKILFEKIEKLSSDSRRSIEATPTPPSFLQPKISNFEIDTSLECQIGDMIRLQSPIFINDLTPNTGGTISYDI